jgi:RimJ/RimL family protein N-acetyltransferase
MAIELRTARLLLRTPQATDVEALHAAVFGDRGAMRFSSHGPARDREESAVWLGRHLDHLALYGFGMGPVIERASGAMVGFAGLVHLEFTLPDVELGYRLHPSVWGRGVATEAARAWLRYGLDTLGLERVVAVVDPLNTASRGVLRKCDMDELGYARHYGARLLLCAVERSRQSTAPASASR